MTDTDRHAPRAPAAISNALFAFAIIYGGMVCIAGVLANKQVAPWPFDQIGQLILGAPLAVEAGIFAFLILVAISSAVAELHGRAIANRLVLIGFVPLIMSMLLTALVLTLPAAGDMDADRLAAFNTIMGGTPRIWAAGIIAYGVSQLLNVTIFSWLKREGGRLLWLRSAVAGVLSQIVDTLLFISIAFYGVFPVGQLILGQALAKVVLSIVLVPFLIMLLVRIGRRLDRAPAD